MVAGVSTEAVAAAEASEGNIDDGDAEQAQGDDHEAGDGAAAQRDHQRVAEAFTGGAGDSYIGADGYLHTDEAGDSGAGCADVEGDQGLDAEVGSNRRCYSSAQPRRR